MCDLERVRSFIVAAQVAFLLVVALLIMGVAASSSFFAATGNVVLMIAVIATAALGVASLVAAKAELDKCDFGPCNASMDELKLGLDFTIATFSALVAVLIGLAVVAPLPFAGAVALSSVLVFLLVAVANLVAFGGFGLIRVIDDFNACQDAQSAATKLNRTVILVLAVVTLVAVVAASMAGYGTGKIPSVPG
jgi:hypothetical protein